MKNIRLKIILILCIVSAGLIVYVWIQNTYQIDFLATKNRHGRNLMINDIQNSNNIDSVKTKAIEIINAFGQKSTDDSNSAIRKSKILIISFFIFLLINILIIIELIRKTPHNKGSNPIGG